jgi:hypothetical protein
MKRCFLYALLGLSAACSLVPSYAGASVIPLLQNGTNVLEDDDFESVVIDLAGSPGLLDVGDRVFGVFRVQNVNGTIIGATDPTVTAIFALEVTGKTGADGAATQLAFGPLQSGGANAATTEWGPFTASLGVTTQLPTNNATMAIFFDHPNFGLTNPNAGSLGASTNTFDETTAISWLAEYGFALGTDQWVTNGQPGVDNPANVIIPGFSATNLLMLSMLVDNPADSVILGALLGTGGFVAPTITDPGDFGLATDTDLVMQVQVVPEPMMVLVFGGLFALAACVRPRKTFGLNG